MPPQALRSRPSIETMRSVPSPAGRFAQPLGLGGVLEMDGQRTVLEDDLIGPALRLLGGARLHGAAFEIDGGALRAQVEADGVEVEPLFEDRGQQVLTAMLLHVIEAAVPIDGALDRLGRQGRGQAVGDAIVLVHHIDHRDSADGAGIERLPARTGVEGGAVEVDGLGRPRRGRPRAR